MEIIGLIPAGGVARRLGRVPCSKEVFPVVDRNGEIRVTSSSLIRYFKEAGIQKVYFIISKGKWDIPEYYGDGSNDGVNVGYLIMNLPYGTPFTLDQAYHFTHDKIVALGYPDIMVHPEDAFGALKNAFLTNDADLILGIVPCSEYLKSDMIEFDESGKIKNIVIKQNRPDLTYSWFGALWRPSFSSFLHHYLESFINEHPNGKFITAEGIERELYVGDIIQEAVVKNMQITYKIFPEGHYIDLGTPGAIRHYSEL